MRPENIEYLFIWMYIRMYYMRYLGIFGWFGAACRNMYRKCSTTQKRMAAASLSSVAHAIAVMSV